MDMDFGAEEDFSLGSKGSSLTRRGKNGFSRRKHKRRRRETSKAASSQEDVSSIVSSSSSSTASASQTPSTSKVSVKGAATSVYAVQDAGTYQMLRDECSYLCSTILTSKNSQNAIDAAIDLAVMISSRKTRSILWQGESDPKQRKNVEDDEFDMESTSPSEPNEKSNEPKQDAIFHSILDVLAKATSSNSNTAKKVGAENIGARSSRTKSARRKMKKLHQQTATAENAGNSKAAIILSHEMKQVLACIFYFLSWDCTMSNQNSVAAMGAAKSSKVARKLRNYILDHPKALQGAALLISGSPSVAARTEEDRSIVSVESSNASSSIGVANALEEVTNNSNANSSAKSSSQVPVDIVQANRSRRQRDKSLLYSPGGASSVSSISFQDEPIRPTVDPTASGRRRRRNRKQNPSTTDVKPTLENENSLDWDATKIIPPPHSLKATDSKEASKLSFTSEERTNDFMAPPPGNNKPEETKKDKTLEDEESKTYTSKSHLSEKVSQKLESLLSKVTLSNNDARPINFVRCQHKMEQKSAMNLWIEMLCLESLNRIITGKEEGGQSCLEGEDDDSDWEEEIEEEAGNPILQTNALIGKSGIIPILAKAMSQSMRAVCQLLSGENCDFCIEYWHDRISILASIIDGACLFHSANRRSFCEDDPFSFVECNEGLIFHILLLLHRFCQDTSFEDENSKISGIMLLTLRTLTSLTHENDIAAKQMKSCKKFIKLMGKTDHGPSRLCGLDILARLVFQLEESDKHLLQRNDKQDHDEALHRYDSTIFCLNTLANIIEAEGVRRILAEIKVVDSSGSELWLKWLCRWLILKTDSFRDAILNIGKGTNQRDLEKNEEDRLVAAGNACVLLACLMTEPEDMSEQPESTSSIRKLIVGQMPRNSDGTETGVTMIVNTLKAFCNFYQFSLGGLSVAVVTPVKKLIDDLEELYQAELE